MGRLTNEFEVCFTIKSGVSKDKYFWGKIDPSHSLISGGWGHIFGIKEGSFIIRSVIPGSFDLKAPKKGIKSQKESRGILSACLCFVKTKKKQSARSKTYEVTSYQVAEPTEGENFAQLLDLVCQSDGEHFHWSDRRLKWVLAGDYIRTMLK